MGHRLIEVIEHEEDAVSQAGWMYADLFLALMVIFLATISFVPEITQGKSAEGTSRLTSSEVKTANSFNFDRGLTIVQKTPDAKSLQSTIGNFLAAQKLPVDSQIVFMQIIGGYDEKTQSQSDGIAAAVKYAFEIQKQNPAMYSNAARSLDASPALPVGEVALRLTFGAKFTK